MLGQPMFLPQPLVIGVRMTGALAARDDRDRPGADAHADAPRARRGRAVRRVLRRRVVDALDRRPRHAVQHVSRVRGDRRVLPGRRARRSRTCAFTGRGDARRLVERYTKEQGLFRRRRRTGAGRSPRCSTWTSCAIEPSLAGPKRPQDRVALPDVWDSFVAAFRRSGPGPERDRDRARSWPRAARRDEDRLPGGDDPLEAAGRRRAATHGAGRLGRDRRHHLVHEHLEPLGDGRRGTAREEGGRGRPADRSRG